MVLSSNEIQKILPHRYPFLMLDKVTELIPGEKAKGIKAVSANEMQFLGHFPEEHVMPGVLIIEALAQLGAIIVLSLEHQKGKIAYFAGIRNAKFRQKVVPGDVMNLEFEVIKLKNNVGIGQGKAYVGEKLVCEAEMTFATTN
ncbi:MAG: 3-hydroxyacyl-ACP dehydratase FabZ [Bacilli bacterium]|jgi:3-hydroxyacyl-[acyl-carrier-protein] dehydratase